MGTQNRLKMYTAMSLDPQTGFLGNLTEAQESILSQFRDYLTTKNQHLNPLHDDWKLLTYCRARKFVLPDVIKMWDDYQKWREENSIDNILGWSDLAFARATIATFVEENVICTDKWHRPVIYQNFSEFK